MNETDDQIKKDAVGILETHLGRETARLYQEYYKDKETPLVLSSLKELLLELLGIKKEQEIVGQLTDRYHLQA